MKKIINLAVFIIISILLTGCDNFLRLGSISNYEITNDIITMENNFSETKINLKITNNTEDYYGYNDTFILEYQKNNNWYLVIPKEEVITKDILYLIEGNSSKELDIYLDNYGALSKGKYRIIKAFSKGDEENPIIYVASEFVIE